MGRIATVVLLLGSFFYGLMMEEITQWLIFALWLMMAGVWLPNILQVVWWRFNAWGYLASWMANLLVSWLVVWVLPHFEVIPWLPDYLQFWLLLALARAVEQAVEKDGFLLLVTQKDPGTENPKPEELYTMGTVATIGPVQRGPSGMRLLLNGLYRGVAMRYEDDDEYLFAAVRRRGHCGKEKHRRAECAVHLVVLRSWWCGRREYLARQGLGPIRATAR